MQKNISSIFLTLSMMFASVFMVRADYSNTVMTLHPVAYWPLNETVLPPAPYVATNSGAWGATANGYYNMWFATNSTGKMAGQMAWSSPVAGATSDGDTAAGFSANSRQYILIPHTYTNTVIRAPFSVECWVYAQTNNNWVNLVAAGGQTGTPVDSSGNEAGFSLDLYGGSFIFDLFNTNSGNHSIELSVPNAYGQWNHLVATYDGTNAILYLNGYQQATGVANLNGAGLGYVPDTINPMEIGILNFAKYGNTFPGAIDEVAIYTNVLSPSDIATHFSDATSGGYYQAVMNNNPAIYLRLNDTYTLPTDIDFAAFPTATNYGSIGSGANGLYEPGTIPGMSGPTGTGFGVNNYSVMIRNVGSGVDVGNGSLTNVAPQLNVTGTNALSVIAWFKGLPSDIYNRFQGFAGHGDSGWRFGYGGDGIHFNPGAGGEIKTGTGNDFNDGFWHMATGVYDGQTNYLYIDNALVASAAYSGSQVGNNRDVLLGGAPDYVARGYDGNLAQIAFFTNVLSAANVQQLYLDAGIYPYFKKQPISTTVNQGSYYTNVTAVGGSPTITFQWYKEGSPVTDQTNSYLGLFPVQATDAGNYYLVAANSGGATTSSVVTLAVLTSPQIQQQPAGTNYVLFPGMSHTMTVVATGAEPLYYYWLSNNVAVAEFTNYESFAAVSYDSANYACVVSNYLGSVTSSVVSITVAPMPTNTYPLAVLADSPMAYWRMGEADTGYPNDGIVAYDNVGGHNGSYTNAELGQPGYPSTLPDPNTAALFGNIAALNSDMQVPSGIDFGTNGNAEFSIEAWVYVPPADVSYVQSDGSGIITKGTGAGGEQFNLDTGSSDSSGAPAFRFFVRNASGAVHLANSSVKVADGNWHHVVGVCDEANAKVSLYVDGALVAQDTSLTAGSGLKASSNPLSIGARQSGTTSYDNQFPGEIDEVAVYNYALSAAQVTTHYYALGVAPAISKQPANTTVNDGGNASFAVVATGTTPLFYQWYDVTSGFPGTLLNGQTNSNLALNGVSLAQNGSLYAVVVTNTFGQVTSSAAQLTVLAGPPVLQADITPSYLKAFVGVQVTYSVSVSGSLPIHYQWYQDGSLVGANTNVYSVSVLPGTNTYSCFVTNVSGSVSSATATLVGISITDAGTNTATTSTTFAVNFMDAANAAYTPDSSFSTWTNVVFEGLGAYPDASINTNWNGFGMFPNGYEPTFDSTTPPQLASDGTLTPITLNLVYGFDSGSLYYGPGVAGNTAQGEPSFILGECAVVNTGSPGIGTSANPLGGITLNHVPAGTYDLYLYSANVNNDRGGVFNFTSGGALGGTNTVINSNPGSGPASNYVYGVTYIIYTNVVPDASGVISGTWGAVSNPNSGNTGEGNFNGLQLVRIGSAPTQIVNMAIQMSGQNMVVSWNPVTGTLQSSTNVAGPYIDLTGVTSPYTNTFTGKQEFFRVKVQ